MKKVLSLFLCLSMAFLIITTSVPVAFAAQYTGACGSNVIWNLDTFTGELVITGSGSMKNYSADSSPSWSSYQNYIKSVIVADGVTSVGDYAFYNITGYKYQKLKTVNLSETVETIGSYAFRGCRSMTTVLGPKVEQIGEYAFRNCESLAVLNLVSVVAVGNGAFGYCTGLTSLPIPPSVTTIGPSAFKGCSGLTSLVLPDNIISLGTQAFAECTGLTSVEFSASNITSAVNGVFNGSGAEIGMDVTFGSNVTIVPEGLFENCPNINQVTLGSGVATVQKRAFYASGVKSVYISAATTSIIDYAFSMCNQLTGFAVDSSNTTFSSGSNGELMNKAGTVLYCYPSGRGVTSYTVSDAVKTIAAGAFFGDTTLEEVNLSNAVNLNAYAFALCTALESISLPSVIVIQEYAFADCNKLNTVSAPKVATVSAGAFHSCESLSALSGFTGLVTISEYAFANCQGFNSFSVPSTVKYINKYAFYNCKNMTAVTIPSSVKTIYEGAFSGCENLNSVTLNEGITKIEQYAFLNCPALLSIKIPASVTSVGSYAFGYKYSSSKYTAVSGFKVYCYSGSAGYTYAYNNKSNLSYEMVTDGTEEEIITPDMPDLQPEEEVTFADKLISIIRYVLDFVLNLLNTNSPFGELVLFL